MTLPPRPWPLDLPLLCRLQEPPPPFAPGEPAFWDDPHIAGQMLAAHLDPHSDAASRRPETIEHSAAWIARALGLRPGDRVLDLGCGPGLYAARLARAGLDVTGVDLSRRSIAYAEAHAREHGLRVTYRCEDYLRLDDEARYDAALLIYGDLCPLAPDRRARLLANVRRALRPGGRFVCDVSTPRLRRRDGLRQGWRAAEGGFWRPGPHLVLEQGFAYPGAIYLDQYIVIEADGTISVYRNWFQDYTAETIGAELAANGFAVESLWSDLAGTPYAEDADWIGVVARPDQL
ncbi:MAG TPA: class I SAM-dependent methyltransferase [Chloroflexaceae bacterium]|nr:class I SAM-dependent methyltransferase [Chloroflexaceae bacterium]